MSVCPGQEPVMKGQNSIQEAAAIKAVLKGLTCSDQGPSVTGQEIMPGITRHSSLQVLNPATDYSFPRTREMKKSPEPEVSLNT